MPFRFVTPLYTSVLFTIMLLIVYPGCNKKTPQSADIPLKRIISLSPSITGQIIDLGAEASLAGVTLYHPPLKKEIPLVGTYISPSIEKIITLKPDIIFISEDDGDIQGTLFFNKFGLRYHRFGRNSDFKSICGNYLLLGSMIGRREEAAKKIEYYKERLEILKRSGPKYSAAFLVSVKPLITVSGRSHISGIIEDAGAVNVFSSLKGPYPILTLESLLVKNPDVVIIMNSGDDIYLRSRLKGFRNINFINRNNIFVAGDQYIPYYSPKEYVLSVEKISEILGRANK